MKEHSNYIYELGSLPKKKNLGRTSKNQLENNHNSGLESYCEVPQFMNPCYNYIYELLSSLPKRKTQGEIAKTNWSITILLGLGRTVKFLIHGPLLYVYIRAEFSS